jgi:NhaA family Na+:H+ antiporter
MFEKLKDRFSTPPHFTSQIVRPFQSFFQKEAASSILLLAAALIAFIWSNSPVSGAYHHLLHSELSVTLGPYHVSRSLLHWINEGLMAIFFFTVGLEIKREMLVGELASLRKAALPAAAALGGMLFPAVIYLTFTLGTPEAKGWGIPMATDIAFALGALAVLGKRIPLSLRIFLSAFAIADDLGAVLVIALFYTQTIVWHYLLICLLLVCLLALANYFWIRWTLFYTLTGITLWFMILGSGLHATVAGIVVAFFIPARGKYDTDNYLRKVGQFLNEFECPAEGCGYSILQNPRHMNAVQSIELACHDVETPLQRLEHALHPWVAFAVIPVFALANGGLSLERIDPIAAFQNPLTLGVLFGLILGKPLGITLFSYLAVKTKIASLPAGITWSHIMGAGLLGGIGFTMSLFISNLSFVSQEMLSYSKLGILTGSLLSGLAGFAILGYTSRSRRAG